MRPGRWRARRGCCPAPRARGSRRTSRRAREGCRRGRTGRRALPSAQQLRRWPRKPCPRQRRRHPAPLRRPVHPPPWCRRRRTRGQRQCQSHCGDGRNACERRGRAPSSISLHGRQRYTAPVASVTGATPRRSSSTERRRIRRRAAICGAPYCRVPTPTTRGKRCPATSSAASNTTATSP